MSSLPAGLVGNSARLLVQARGDKLHQLNFPTVSQERHENIYFLKAFGAILFSPLHEESYLSKMLILATFSFTQTQKVYLPANVLIVDRS